jgi:mannose-6-phosphate isomerase-like protein (cupin superfamily)
MIADSIARHTVAQERAAEPRGRLVRKRDATPIAYRRAMANPKTSGSTVTSETSAVWTNHVPMAGTPEGFTLRTTFPTNPRGVEVMLERWAAGTAEPPHSHPGDDMTVVVEGRMAIQFYTRTATGLAPDGELVVLEKGATGYVKASRIHDARYLEDCKLVYVHDGAFGFTAES